METQIKYGGKVDLNVTFCLDQIAYQLLREEYKEGIHQLYNQHLLHEILQKL